jgi:hypothetical protein
MIRHLILTLALLTAATPALSLSCMRPDAVRMFEYARDSDDVFYVIKGRLTPTSPYAIPKPENDKDTEATTLVQISGLGLSRTDFSVPVEIGATVRLSCLSVWCAGPPPEGELLMIVKKTGEDLTLELGPCGGTAIPWSVDAENRLLKCHQTKSCKPAQF